MFNRLSAVSLYVVFALALLAAATPAQPAKRWDVTTTVTVTPPAPTQTAVSQCNTGSIQCCNEVLSASGGAGGLLLGLLGILLSDLNVLLGSTCSPITIAGIAGGACSAHPVCCQNNSFGGLISIGCIPIVL